MKMAGSTILRSDVIMVTVGNPEPFKVHAPDADVAEFEASIRNEKSYKRVVSNSLSPDGVEPSKVVDGRILGQLDFTYGLPLSVLEPLRQAASEFSWRGWEKRIRAMGEHYHVRIHGDDNSFQGSVDMHYIIRKSSNNIKKSDRNRRVIVLLHGWPGSFMEFMEAAPLLDDAGYDLIIPSLVGFGFSGSQAFSGLSGKSPWTLSDMAACIDSLMQKLSYIKYFVQGGDIGSAIARRVAQLYPSRCCALHLNVVTSTKLGDYANDESLTQREKLGVERFLEFDRVGRGYHALQGTAPYTIGAALCTNPLSLVLYLSEKWLRWADPNTRPKLDEIFAGSCLYWLNNNITSSFWLYYNGRTGDGPLVASTRVEVPVAIHVGLHEISWIPRKEGEKLFNVKSWGEFEKGGHFIACECPELFARDVSKFFDTIVL